MNATATTPSESLAHKAAPAASPAYGWLDPAQYAFAPHRFQTAEGSMHYVAEGQGAPVFLVHGTPSWSFEWRHVIRGLSPRHRVIAPDLLGFGLSDKPEAAPYRPEDHARRLLALFDHLDLHDVTLVVHDFGGPIGLPIALERSARVSRVVVLNSWMWPLGDDPRAARLSRLIRGPLGRFLYLRLNASPRWLVPMAFAKRARLTPEAHRQYIGPFLRRHERSAPWVLGCELTGSDAYYATLWSKRGVLAEKPLTLVWGEKDTALRPEQRARWQAAFPHARVVLCNDAGHFPQEEGIGAVLAAIEGHRGTDPG